ncbi:protoporphyrinogen oxidase HemJ [Synechococcus sp. PCC 7336]|uniref:protoporphyrinogen oxidase HemJ n=1 Tax=Synechococcus sp. PCC 7336 TaxID=195250 RepID=UPI00034AFECC|nr:protoporphyrinogen oxidase HemJ [Synechococcus sp. PCC 7336]
MAYLWLKVFHIVGVVVWFSGLFYLVRLFIYDVEASGRPEPAKSLLKSQYRVMEKRLLNIIATPGMIVTLVMAMGLLASDRTLIHQQWLQLKLGLVLLLILYHFYCRKIFRNLSSETCGWTGQQLRLLNELPTVLLIAVVSLAIFKDGLPIYSAALGLIGLVLLMILAIYFYAKKRRISQEVLIVEAN